LSLLEYYLRNFLALVMEARVENLEDRYLEFIMGEAYPDSTPYYLEYIGVFE